MKPRVARTIAANSQRWWRDSAKLLNSVLTIAYFDRLEYLAYLDLNYSNRPVRTRMPVVWQGSGPFGLPPMPIVACRLHTMKSTGIFEQVGCHESARRNRSVELVWRSWQQDFLST